MVELPENCPPGPSVNLLNDYRLSLSYGFFGQQA